MIITGQIKIERLKKGDFSKFVELVRLFEDVFEMKNFLIPESIHLQKLLKRNNFFVFVAVLEDRVVGGLTAYVLDQYYSKKPLAYIFDLVVDKNFHRMGIGKKLISATNSFFKEKGFEEVFVQADKTDKYAIDFYRSTKPSEEEQVVHFYYNLTTTQGESN